MQTRYKTILAVLVGLLIAPQITFAAWWNPTTWFRKVSTPTKVVQVQVGTTTPPIKTSTIPATPKVKQETAIVKSKVSPQVKTANQPSEIEKLKKEVEELRKKVTTPTSSSPKPSSPGVSSPVPTKTESQQKDEKSYKDYLIGYFNFPIAKYNNSKNWAEKSISMVEDAVQAAKKDRASFTGFRDNDPNNNIVGMNPAFNYLIESYNNEVKYYEKTLSNFSNIITKINADIKLLAEEKMRMTPLSFTKEQVIEETKRISNYYDAKLSSIDAEITEIADDFVKYHDKKQDEYEELFAYLKARLGPSAVPEVRVRILNP